MAYSLLFPRAQLASVQKKRYVALGQLFRNGAADASARTSDQVSFHLL
jgi:hypothetical protein